MKNSNSLQVVLSKKQKSVFNMSAPWLTGTVAGFTFQAMVFDEASYYGINEGRISKLFITADPKNWSKCTTEYDRGWSVDAKETLHVGAAAIEAQAAVIAFLETLPVNA